MVTLQSMPKRLATKSNNNPIPPSDKVTLNKKPNTKSAPLQPISKKPAGRQGKSAAKAQASDKSESFYSAQSHEQAMQGVIYDNEVLSFFTLAKSDPVKMNSLLEEIFENKESSTSEVLKVLVLYLLEAMGA